MSDREQAAREFDHEYTQNIVCPWCGFEDVDSWEYTDSCDDIACGKCEKPFVYERIETIEYVTRKKEAALLAATSARRKK